MSRYSLAILLTRLGCAVTLALICNVKPSSAQMLACAEQYLMHQPEKIKSAEITASEAEQLIQQVATAIALTGSITAVSCDFFSKKVVAWPGGTGKVPEGEYVIYNPVWVREVIGTDRVQAIALFGHELGHFLNRHFGARKSLPDVDKEKEADRFAGCAVALMQGDWLALEDLLSRIRDEEEGIHPNRLASLEAAQAGFKKCGAIQNMQDPVQRRINRTQTATVRSSETGTTNVVTRCYQAEEGWLIDKGSARVIIEKLADSAGTAGTRTRAWIESASNFHVCISVKTSPVTKDHHTLIRAYATFLEVRAN